MYKIIITITLLLCLSFYAQSQKLKTDANLTGHVISDGEHIPYASVFIKGTTIGTVTDQTGHYKLVNLPVGELTVVAKVVGYESEEQTIIAEANITQEINFSLEKDVLNLEEVVVSADRSEQKRTQAPVIVNTISPDIFQTSESVTLGEGLNFSPGLRLENNCQNCGFTQVRMNGMEGPYSQILINSRPIFSGLAGVYGLELIPVNMIEKVEVVRGGGSSLYGSNAIAGTINILLKDPVINSYEIGTSYYATGIGLNGSGGIAPDYNLNFNTSVVSDDNKSGVSIFGFTRKRELFDANGDKLSEISPMDNLTAGIRMFHRFGNRNKLSLDFFTIKEERDGGNMQEYPLHEREVAEAVKHDLATTAFTFDQYFREYDQLSLYASGQFLDRDSYYGANQSMSDYGNSKDRTYNIGGQYKAVFDNSSIITGVENTGSFLIDKKLGYPDYDKAIIQNGSIVEIPHIENIIVANQSSITSGVFTQFEQKFERAKIAAGARYDYYEINDLAQEDTEAKSGVVFSPRVSLMYEVLSDVQARLSYSKGYRAPQIFDEDLHIETSGARQVINVNDPDLKQETSHSTMASLDYNAMLGNTYTGFLAEVFYTRLQDPFVNDIGEPEEDGTVYYTRINANNGATVKGLNMEFKLIPSSDFSLTSGFTIQSSHYDEPQEFGEKRFFRTPDNYGYFVLDWDFYRNFCFSTTGNYTGSMLVPYFGPETDPDEGELRTSGQFMDLGLKLKQTIKINGSSLQWFIGLKNIFNSYQSDFDMGPDRDPAYMYGPVSPRTLYFGVKFGNMLD
ncbi:MAG: TonB-dependent receptor [Bacteroidota bacterium]